MGVETMIFSIYGETNQFVKRIFTSLPNENTTLIVDSDDKGSVVTAKRER
jgi:hypothetical protein